jgi:hypothetical protein
MILIYSGVKTMMIILSKRYQTACQKTAAFVLFAHQGFCNIIVVNLS